MCEGGCCGPKVGSRLAWYVACHGAAWATLDPCLGHLLGNAWLFAWAPLGTRGTSKGSLGQPVARCHELTIRLELAMLASGVLAPSSPMHAQ
ncbi:hypothetical protein CsSME_00042481 [Camellia sinensis var. sinensis]